MTIPLAHQQQLLALYPFLQGLARKITNGNRELAEDIAQDVCCNFLAATHHYQDEGQLKGYLARALRNRYADWCRRSCNRCELPSDPDDAVFQLATAASQHTRLELRDTLNALDRLPQSQAMAVIHSALGVEYDELAARQHIPAGTVKSRTSRGRATLRELA